MAGAGEHLTADLAAGEAGEVDAGSGSASADRRDGGPIRPTSPCPASPHSASSHSASSHSASSHAASPYQATADGDANLEQRQRRARLARTIEGEIIPRLKLAHGLESAEQAQNGEPVVLGAHTQPNAEDVRAFAKLVISQDVGVALAHIELLRAHATSLDTIFLHLLSPTAHLLGDLWLADECSFIDVTVGLARLQQILRELTPAFEPELSAEAHPRRRILLQPAPGEQHTFGLSIIEHFFRRDGWEVAAAPQSCNSMTGVLRKEWFALVGFSASCVELLDGLQSFIRSLRHTSRNPELRILVGGKAFNDRPELVMRVGADAMAGDGRQAVVAANSLVTPSGASTGSARARGNWKRNGAAGLTRHGSPV